VLIGTAVVGATTMIFSIIVVLTHGLTQNLDKLSLSIRRSSWDSSRRRGDLLVHRRFDAGGDDRRYRAVEFIKANIRLEGVTKASVTDSKRVVEICTQYAQKGMFNIFLTVFFSTLAFAFLEPYFFIGYLMSIALFGSTRRCSWPTRAARGTTPRRSSRWIEGKGTALHAATVIGDTSAIRSRTPHRWR